MEDWLDKLEEAPQQVIDAFQKASAVINAPQYEAERILCSISGGSDSDIMLDLLCRVDTQHKIKYLFSTLAYKNCFSYGTQHGTDQYRPLFWFSEDNKQWYEERFDIKHSRCYTEYGLKRTGYTGCPFARDLFAELNSVGEQEQGMVTAAKHIFGHAYPL